MHRRTRYKRLAAWLGLGAVLFLQIQIAGHSHLEHASSGSHEEVCEVCLKLDKSGSVPLVAASTTIAGQAAGAPACSSAPDAATRAHNAHSARGPPTV